MKFNLDIEDFIDPCTCHAWVATAVIGSAVIGAGASIYGSNKAAQAQENAANTAANTAEAQYQTTRGDLAPFRQGGTDALKQLQDAGFYTNPIEVNPDVMLNDPNSVAGRAYNFTKTQGLKSVQNSAAARGLGVSGAALKGAANFATGLADNTYQNLANMQFNFANANQTNAYNRLKGIIDTGESAGAQTGVLGASAANTAAGAQIGAGNAAAAGYNAIGGAVNNAANNIGGYYAYKGLYGGGNQPVNDGWKNPDLVSPTGAWA